MPDSGGVFSRVYNWVVDRDASVPITASRMDTELDGIATALNNRLFKDGANTPTANLPMGGFLHTGVGAASARTHYARADQVQDDSLKYAAVTGTDTYAATLAPAITAYANGLTFIGKFANANSGAATLNLNTVGAVDIKKAGGAALVAGDIAANTVHTLVYNSTGPKFELVSPSSNQYQPLDADLTAIAAATVLRGAIIYGNSTPAWAALTVGGASTVLRSDGTDVSWGTVATAAIADNAVTGAKIAMGSDAQGDVLYYNGTDYARLGAGTSGQFLKTQGAAANPTWAYAGLVPILRVNGSAVADYQWTSTTAAAAFNGTFRTLKLIGWLQPATDDSELYFRISDDGGSTYEADAGDYRYNTQSQDDGGTNRGIVSTADTKWRIGSNDATLAVGNASDERIQFELTFSNLDSAAFKKMFDIKLSYIAATGALITGQGACQVVAVAAITGIQLLFESGNIAAGDVTLYGVVNA